ncbi:MAG: hemerythrin domain-containing protein [Leptospirales bacterium]
MLIEWTSDLAIGAEKIDEQHRRLIQIINNIADSINEGVERSSIKKFFLELGNYCNYHFSMEEMMQLRMSY